MFDEIPKEMKGESATPVAHHLFDTAHDTTILSRTDTDLLHHFVTHILYLPKQACQ